VLIAFAFLLVTTPARAADAPRSTAGLESTGEPKQAGPRIEEMLICLIAGDQVVAILKKPLRNAKARYPGTNEVWTIFWGTNVIKTLKLSDDQQAVLGSGSNRYRSWKIDLIPSGTNGFTQHGE
jgi:hypothetical protein